MSSDGPRVLIAVDKFKGCLRGGEVAAHLRDGIISAIPGAQVRMHPVADGGDGFAGELAPHGFVQHAVGVQDALGRPLEATFAMRGDVAVIEMALASGLQLIPAGQREPLRADTFGLGLLMRAAGERSPRRIVVGAGGSATSDGGAGALAALGADLFDSRGTRLRTFGPDALAQVHRVDLSALEPWRAIDLQVATDVSNPLLGPEGAAAVFGPQKGAAGAQIEQIENALRRWADTLETATGALGRDQPGAGAAGGLGFGLNLGLGATMVDGLGTFAALTNLAEAVAWSEVVITGEGSLDSQTTSGKAPAGVLRYAQAAGRPCWVVAGRSDLTDDRVRELGFAGQRRLMDLALDQDSSMREAPTWLHRVGEDLGAQLRASRGLSPLYPTQG